MRALVLLSLCSIAAAKPGGLLSGWGDPHGLSSLSVVQQPIVQQYVAQPVVHAAPVVHAPVAIAKPAATSYSSFQRVIHPVAVAHAPVISQPVVHAPVVSQPIVQVAQPLVHAPVIQQPIVQSYAQPVVSKVLSVGSYGSYGHGW